MPLSFSSPRPRDAYLRGTGVTAVLGPTNTGKTHLAIERMLAHSSGVIGLPLRLLAREVYNKIVERAGSDAVALITGEEKIKPAHPRYWVATAEAMPRDLDVAFLAVDEIQVGADLERGHVFTDHILNRRAREETLILGAATMRPIIEKLLPGANIVSRPRLSQLTFAGEKKLSRLPRRSAIVAFSAEEVYAIAELIRRQRGGAAVVLGALSPRTRNAQVALYQSGDVDYLVATDAIGMGLNLDVDHVAFASDRKFDGYQYRKLNPSELAQIAGRAGRAMRDGTFGTTGRCPPFEPELVQQLESHTFEPVRLLQWRNSALEFSSIGALQASLAITPQEQGLTRAPVGEDILVLDHAARDEAVRAVATSRAAVEKLWDVCQVPDYRKIAPATHAELVTTLYGFLMREGTIPTDWFARQVEQASRTDGGIDTLSNRIAHVRTWTFVANRPDWLADPVHWQNVTRAVEDKLSDALHERLAERFVDRRTSVLMRRLREDAMLETEIGKTGEVTVEGHIIGRLEGFVFAADASAGGSEAKALQATAQKALAGEIDARAMRLSEAPDEQLVLASDGVIRWTGDTVGKLMSADDVLHPRVRIVADEQLTGASRDAVQARLDLWLKTHIEKLLGPLFILSAAEDVTGMARGIAFQLVEALGVLDRQKVADAVKGLEQESRATLRKYGVRFGAYHIYFPHLLKPAPRLLAAQLWALKNDGLESKGLDELRALATGGRTSMPADKEISQSLYRVAGYRVCGVRAVRVDILERLADLIRPALVWREGAPGEKPPGAIDGFGFTVSQGMTSLTGASGEDFASILKSLGYRVDRRPKPAEAPQAAAEQAAPTEAVAADPGIDIGVAGAAPVVPDAATDNTADAATTESSHDQTALETAPAEDSAAPEAATAQDHPDHPAVDEVPVQPAEAQTAPAGETAAPVHSAQLLAAPDLTPAGEPEQQVVPEAAAEPAATILEHAAPETAAEAPVAAESSAAALEAEFIEVWRPGRPADEHRRQRPAREARRSPRRDTRPGQDASGAPAATDATAAVSPDGPGVKQDSPQDGRPDRQQQRPQHRHPRKGGPDKGRAEGRPEGGRPQKSQHKSQRPPRDNGRPAFYQARAPQERAEKAPDPNSPFAKLAALKAQLEANKERS